MGCIIEQKSKVRVVTRLVLKLNKLISDFLISLYLCFVATFKRQVFNVFEKRNG